MDISITMRMFNKECRQSKHMAERRFRLPWRRVSAETIESPVETAVERVGIANKTMAQVAGLSQIFEDTEILRNHKKAFKRTKFDDEFDLYDEMLRLDPELNGAVRSVALTANNWSVDYASGKNRRIRAAIKELVEERLDFDDILINMLRNLMVYGNDINKLVGKTGVGITGVESLPIHQITIKDDRGIQPPSVTRESPITVAKTYLLRENETYPKIFDVSEILHVRMDFRSNWFQDRLGRWSYGVWGASRFSALKQAIRAKYNTINNRISLEEALTKQYVTIGMQAIEHIQDPEEAQARLGHIMDEVAKLLEGLRGDQIPILPEYVKLEHMDLRNTIPDSTSFLDMVNADISAFLQVPRVAAGQERGSTFAATYQASMWSINAIRRLQKIAQESCNELFIKHLELLGIPAKKGDLPRFEFAPLEEESRSETTKRASLGYQQGVFTQNEARHLLGMQKVKGGDEFKDGASRVPFEQTRSNTTKEEEL